MPPVQYLRKKAKKKLLKLCKLAASYYKEHRTLEERLVEDSTAAESYYLALRELFFQPELFLEYDEELVPGFLAYIERTTPYFHVRLEIIKALLHKEVHLYPFTLLTHDGINQIGRLCYWNYKSPL